MSADKHDKFQIRIDGDQPDSLFSDNFESLRIEQLSRKVTIFTVLLPIVFIILIAAAYMDIRFRVLKADSAETGEVTQLSKALESRFSSLSVKYAKLEESFNKTILPMEEVFAVFEQQNATIKDQISQLQVQFEALNGTSIDRPTLDIALETVQASQGSQREELAMAVDEITALDEKFSQKIIELTETFDALRNEFTTTAQRLSQFSAEIDTLTETKLDKTELALKLIAAEDSIQQKIGQRIQQIEEQLNSISGVSAQQQPDVKKKRALKSASKADGISEVDIQKLPA